MHKSTGEECMRARQHAFRRSIVSTAAVALLAGCAQTPLGPTVQVMPGPGKSFDVFQSDQAGCKVYAASQVQGQAEQANQRAAGAAVLTTLLGAGLGAAVGSGWGAAGSGAGIGAAAGVATGTAVGAGMSSGDQYNIQVQYDNSYSQCMFAKGEMVPGYAPTAAMTPYVAGSAPSVGSAPDPLVRSVQIELVRLNYLDGAPDGVPGARTHAAIQSFERANGMAVDGAASPRLLAKLQGTASSQVAATASAPTHWVAPATPGSGTAPAASTGTPATPSDWVSPVKSP
jgi:uncharacterized protein YcfJ